MDQLEEEEEHVDEQTARLRQLTRDVELLEIENDLLEDFVAQAEQQGLIIQCQAGCKVSKPSNYGRPISVLEFTSTAEAIFSRCLISYNSTASKLGNKPGRVLRCCLGLQKSKSTRRRKEQEAKAEALPKLTEDEKSDIVNQAVEALQDVIQQTKVNGEKDVDDIRTLMEEIDTRIKETKQETYEFKRDVILGAEDVRTGKTNAEKVIKFMEDQIHDKEVLIEKLTLKNTTNKAAIAKLEAQLAHKEEMGEVLHLVDFEQLKIENQQYFERIDGKNKELLQLKLSTGKTVQMLNNVKSRLSSLMAEGAQLRVSISTKQRELDNFESDFQKTASQSSQAAAGYKKLQAQQKDAEQPQIIEYIKLKAQAAELQKEAASWQRKLEVAHAAAARGSSGSGARSPSGGGSRSRTAALASGRS